MLDIPSSDKAGNDVFDIPSSDKTGNDILTFRNPKKQGKMLDIKKFE